MCWCSGWVETPGRRIAEDDIPVFKILYKTLEGKYISPHRSYSYNIGEVYKSDIVLSVLDNYFVIDVGLHSYSIDCVIDINTYGILVNDIGSHFILDSYYQCSSSPVLMNCIIPKGSTYYKNKRGEIVSDELMVIGEADVSQFKVY
jgi:hypothetical protein